MLQDKVRRQLKQWERDLGLPLWLPEETIVVGVSGGPDSLALLHMLARNGLHNPRRLHVGHLDHRLRESSGSEAQAVAQLCARWGLDCTVESVEIAAIAREKKLSIEEAARHARYMFLGNLARTIGGRRIVVGHTADDQAETVLMHFVRGAGLDGLRGMAPVSSLSGFEELLLVRPLLSITRQDVTDYCATHALDPVFDPSNEDMTYFRNRLRHELLPILEMYNPQIRERLLHTAEVVRADVGYLNAKTGDLLDSLTEGQSQDHLRLALQPWRQLPLSLRRRTLRAVVWRLRRSLRDVGFAPVEQARRVAEDGAVGARSNLPAGLELVVGYDTFVIQQSEVSPTFPGPQVTGNEVFALAVPGHVGLANGWRIRAEVSTRQAFRQHCEAPSPWREFIDGDVAGSLFVRTRRRGERMKPLGMQGKHARLSDIMIDAKVPKSLRRKWPVVANRVHVIWLAGIRLDDRIRIQKDTQRVIQLRCDHIGATE